MQGDSGNRNKALSRASRHHLNNGLANRVFSHALADPSRGRLKRPRSAVLRRTSNGAEHKGPIGQDVSGNEPALGL
jgi:hypothetical protein